jgi:ABC-2 type transport system permease protein
VSAPALPPVLRLLRVQLRYHVRRMVRTPRALSTGMLLPVVLLVLADPRSGAAAVPRVAALAVLGAGMTAWTTHAIGLVAARELGELRRWRATPVPPACLLGARVVASVLVASLGGLVTIVLGAGYGVQLDAASLLTATGVLLLGSSALATTSTALTRLASTIDSAWPVLGLSYLPMILTAGGVGGTGDGPRWLQDLTRLLPVRPTVLGVRAALGPGSVSGLDLAVLAGWAVLGLAAAARVFRWDPSPPRP